MRYLPIGKVADKLHVFLFSFDCSLSPCWLFSMDIRVEKVSSTVYMQSSIHPRQPAHMGVPSPTRSRIHIVGLT